MIRTTPKGYLAPWSSRRETAGLMGTFLVFYLGLNSHSEQMLNQTKHLAQQLTQLILVLLGLATPVTPPAKPTLDRFDTPVRANMRGSLPAHSLAIPNTNSMLLRMEPSLTRYHYVFEGKATYQNQPCPNASVLVRLTSGERSVTRGTVTETDGSYVLQVSIEAGEKDPVDWAIEAYTPDFNKVEISGRRIVQHEDEQEKKPIVVTNPVEFILSSLK